MFVSIYTMFLIPCPGFGPMGVNPLLGSIPMNLDIESSKVKALMKKGLNIMEVCEAFRFVFDHVDFGESSTDFKLKLLSFIHGKSSLNESDLNQIRTVYHQIVLDICQKKSAAPHFLIPIAFWEKDEIKEEINHK